MQINFLQYSVFWHPVYCGKIHVSQYKDEENITVQGKHEPIISEALYYEVQNVLSGRQRNSRHLPKITADKRMPLRGFLICPKCGRMLTGSASKGHTKTYYYYHCVSSCGCRFKTKNANDLFVNELRKYVPKPGMSELFKIALKEAFHDKTKGYRSECNQLLSRIDELNLRLKNAREMVADQKLDPEDFRELKLDCTNQITQLEAKLDGSSVAEKSIDGLLAHAVNSLSRLDIFV